MRSIVLTLVLALLLSGCAPAGGTLVVTSTPNSMQSLATPFYGGVTILSGPGYITVDLRKQPNAKAPIIGHVSPDDKGKVLGVDASGLWLLVEIKKQTGWVAAQYVNYTIAQ